MDLRDGDVPLQIAFKIYSLAPLGQFSQVVASGGVKFKNLFNFLGFFSVNINSSGFRIIEIAERSFAWPYAVSHFLPHSTRYILA
ncbi:MAG: hypothetical protein A2659_04680 [Candidatus Yanofskybacteria bacterium RIFCSPHIGHO2_01_FULL_44_24]|nr:MAG: hypothetical protein A2659_04680 [Candidatus Yanofskybacteria bacterium RIFCSPHIGHO2_01_FULL_44_24]